MAKKILLSAAGGAVTGDAFGSNGGSAMFGVIGTFDSASVALQVTMDGTNWSPLHESDGTDVAVTAETQDVYADEIKQGMSVRAVTSGGGGSCSLTVIMEQ